MSDHRIRLAIVGSVSFPEWWHVPAAEGIISAVLDAYRPRIEVVISGGAEGIDSLAADLAEARGIPVVEHLPKYRRWEPEGYKARNQLIAEDCTDLLCIRHESSKTFGSGWTANTAEVLGRQVQRVVFPAPDSR